MSSIESKSAYNLFPYDEPRYAQKNSMEIISESVENNGIVTMEGACGTGKTLAALVPSLSYTRKNNTKPQRVFIVTSVKQQMSAFQDEIERINNNLPSSKTPVSALTLVSVSDLHPYVDEGVIESQSYSHIDKLREGTRVLESDYDYSFKELYKNAEQISNENSKYAYSTDIPVLKDIEYDPYYAKYRAEKAFYDEEDKDLIDMIPFNVESIGLLDVEKIRRISATNGLCPHSIMRTALPFVDVVIGNYTHIFDPKTSTRITNPIINDETITIFDEAHNLCPRVRTLISKDTSFKQIVKSQDEIREVSLLYELSRLSKTEVKQIINEAASDSSTSSNMNSKNNKRVKELSYIIKENGTVMKNYSEALDMREDVRKVLDEMKITPEELDKYVSYLNDLQNFMSTKIEQEGSVSEDSTIQLRDPEKPDYDDLTTWTELGSHSSSIMKNFNIIGETVDMARNKCTDSSITKITHVKSVGDLLSTWYDKDYKRYYRAIEFEKRYENMLYPVEDWQKDCVANLTLHNCIPRDEISEKLGTFHSSILMSATLEPIDIYNKTVGIDLIEENTDREVYSCKYGLSFPRENRTTLGISAPKFKYSNKGKAFNSLGKPNLDNSVRKKYYDIVYDILNTTEGSTLIVMPNYNEAQWIGSLLESERDLPINNVFIDESSSNHETSVMKERFFKENSSVLVTGAGGTLIEGVDYIGDRLNNVIVCGVPISNISSDYMKAVRAAYGAVFNQDGFELAFTIPAVWKTRQALGRVIRTDKDVGTRIVIDDRYTINKNNTSSNKSWDSVQHLLGTDEKKEMKVISGSDVKTELNNFWNNL